MLKHLLVQLPTIPPICLLAAASSTRILSTQNLPSWHLRSPKMHNVLCPPTHWVSRLLNRFPWLRIYRYCHQSRVTTRSKVFFPNDSSQQQQQQSRSRTYPDPWIPNLFLRLPDWKMEVAEESLITRDNICRRLLLAVPPVDRRIRGTGFYLLIFRWGLFRTRWDHWQSRSEEIRLIPTRYTGNDNNGLGHGRVRHQESHFIADFLFPVNGIVAVSQVLLDVPSRITLTLPREIYTYIFSLPHSNCICFIFIFSSLIIFTRTQILLQITLITTELENPTIDTIEWNKFPWQR